MTDSKKPLILIVDDEDEARTLLQMALTREEYEVTTSNSAEDALRKLAVLSFDVVLTDIRLTGEDGIHLLREIQLRWPDIVKIVLTAYPTLDTAVAALRAGAYDYLSKPCPPSEIRRVVHEGLAKQRGTIKRLELMRALEQQLMEGMAALREQQQALVNRPTEAMKAAGNASGEGIPLPLVIPNSGTIIRAGPFLVDRVRHIVLLGDSQLDLTPSEFDMLALLAERAPGVISQQELLRRVLNYDAPDKEAKDIIRWHMHHLRRKVETDPDKPQFLKNVRGVGYKLEIT